MQVAGAVGLVTGGGGGLGAGAVRMLARGGARVGILDLPDSPGALALVEEFGDAVRFVPTDVADPDQVAAAVAAVVDAFGRIDVLVNAVGIVPAARMISRSGDMFPLDLFRKTLDINLIGSFDVLRHTAKAMSANEPGVDGERGLLVNVTSMSAFEGQAGQAAYTASKGAIASMTLQLARDLGSWGIRVMSIAPGIMDTPALQAMGEERREALVKVPVFPKRFGTPEDFAAVVRCCMEVTLFNGEVIRLDAATRLGG
jgi:3-hydroxyacyl-CoA dehydrogenase / 3-hydroxy-2-methylbutyryl-CoA dehydrogenase